MLATAAARSSGHFSRRIALEDAAQVNILLDAIQHQQALQDDDKHAGSPGTAITHR